MTGKLQSYGNAFLLLKQLEHLLESDTLIDEVGFIHPSQFAALDDGRSPVDISVNAFKYDNSILWSRDHKLAISTQALLPPYNAAKHAFMTALMKHKGITGLPEETDHLMDENSIDSISISHNSLESEVMKHSKALLLLSCDYRTAWNIRELVAKKEQHFSLFMDELQLSTLILSYSPKSESAWSHRRWVIKAIYAKYPNILDIVERKSELVEKIEIKDELPCMESPLLAHYLHDKGTGDQ